MVSKIWQNRNIFNMVAIYPPYWIYKIFNLLQIFFASQHVIQCSKFPQNHSIFHWDIMILWYSKVAVCHLGLVMTWQYCNVTHVFISTARMATWMKIDPYCQRQNCSPLNVLFSNIYITLILLSIPLPWVYNHNTVSIFVLLSRTYICISWLSCSVLTLPDHA